MSYRLCHAKFDPSCATCREWAEEKSELRRQVATPPGGPSLRQLRLQNQSRLRREAEAREEADRN